MIKIRRHDGIGRATQNIADAAMLAAATAAAARGKDDVDDL